jgi:putative inorganic carbon (HCO3(-)) transporter
MKGLILTYVITASAAFGALRYPLFGLYVYVCFAVLRPQSIWGYAGDLSSISLIVGIALLVGWAFQGFGSWRLGRGRPVVMMLVMFVVWFALSAAAARETTRAWWSLWDMSKMILPFFVGVTMMKTEKDWRPLLWTIVLCQGYVAFEQNWNYVVKGFNTAAEGFGGMDNNCFGVSLVTVIGPAMALAISSKSLRARWLAIACTAFILHTVLLTFSRGAMVGLIAVAVTAFVMMPKRPKYIFAMLVAVLVAVRFTGPQLADRYASAFVSGEDRDSSSESRLDLWRDCLLVVEANPIFGVGPANWPVVAADYGWPEGKSAHSVWMETAAENGIPGTLFLLLFFGVAAARLWPIARSRLTETNRYEVVLATGVILSIVGFCVAGQFVSVPGLEVPYYITMLAAVMLRSRADAVAEAPVTVLGPRLPYQAAPPFRQLPTGGSLAARG